MPYDPQSGTSQDKIKGNLSLQAKQLLSNPGQTFGRLKEPQSIPVFGDSIHRNFVATEAWIQSKREEEKQKEAMLVIELDVTDGKAFYSSQPVGVS
jgi:acyl-coenzyme A thioesterase 13